MASSRPEEPSPALPTTNLLISKARAPLQQHLLPHLTADAIAALHTASKATHELLTSAPFEVLQPALQSLLPPQIRCCATSHASMQALLSSQAAFCHRIRTGAPIAVLKLKLKRGESAWDARWAPEHPCRSLLLECEDDDFECRELLLDPSTPNIRPKQPTSRWIDQQGRWGIHCFLPAGALLFTRDCGIAFAILDMDSLSITATWSGEYQSNKFEASISQKYVYVEQSIKKRNEIYSLTARDVTVLEQPSLQQKHVLPSPMLEVNGQQQQASCHSIDPSPDQEYLAIIWRVNSFEGNMQAQSLCIYAMSDGREVAEFDILALLPDLHPTQVPMAQLLWSPDSCEVIIRGLPGRSKQPFTGQASPVVLCGLNRSYRFFTSIPKPHAQALSWSPDGQYVHFDCWEPAEKFDDPPDESRTRGAVYRAADGHVSFEWSHSGPTVPSVWSAKGCSLFLPSCKKLITLPGKDVGGGINQQIWEGPDLPAEDHSTFPSKQPVFVPMPSGRILVGAWSALAWPAQGPSNAASSSRTAPARQAHQLCHVLCDPSAPACTMTAVATSVTSWLTKTIAWHPGPRTAHIYAIATACGSLHLMDAKQHKRLRIWTWMDLAGQQRNTASLQMPELSWSLDGMQILVSLEGSASLLTFTGVSGSAAPASSGRRRRR